MDKLVKILHYCTTNDTNGNPRRAYLGVNEYGAVVAAADEGYAGYDAAPWIRPFISETGKHPEQVKVSVSRYRDVLRFAASR